jgi:hypothetical protein
VAQVRPSLPKSIVYTVAPRKSARVTWCAVVPNIRIFGHALPPWLRCVGESWPLTLDRAFYEHAALVEEARHMPHLVPEVGPHPRIKYHFTH